MKTIILHQCPVRFCAFKSARADKVREHCGRMHPTAFDDDDDRRKKLAKLPQEVVLNQRYMDPEGATPPECVRGIPAPQVDDANTAPPAEVAVVRPLLAPVTGALILKRTAPPSMSPQPAKRHQQSPPRPVAASLSPEDDRALPRNELCKRIFRAEHDVLVLQRRIRQYKHILKEKERADAECREKALTERKNTVRLLREELKSKDKTIRQLQLRQCECLNRF